MMVDSISDFSHVDFSGAWQSENQDVTFDPVPGAQMAAPSRPSESIDQNFESKYEMICAVGSGGMGVVYKARQKMLNKIVAIKMVHEELVSHRYYSRFLLEGRATAMLTHPYIVEVHDFGMSPSGQAYLVMDFVDGCTLAELLASMVRLPIDRFLHIFTQVADALWHAHSRGIVHRDIKPGNIMIVPNFEGEEEIRLMDFGVAKFNEPCSTNDQYSLTRIGMTVGSPLYMSPEQAVGSTSDPRTDLYSLGCVMYEAITGYPPLKGNNRVHTMIMHLNEEPEPIANLNANDPVEGGLIAMVSRLLQKDPEARYQSIRDVRNELTSYRALRLAANTGTRCDTTVTATNIAAMNETTVPEVIEDRRIYWILALALPILAFISQPSIEEPKANAVRRSAPISDVSRQEEPLVSIPQRPQPKVSNYHAHRFHKKRTRHIK